MKHILRVLIIYTIIALAICICGSVFYGHLPDLLDNAVSGFKFLRGIQWFLLALPALLISSFLIGGSIEWKTADAYDNAKKFSAAMGKRYKDVIIIAIVITCLLTLSNELLLPVVNKKIKRDKENPALLKKALFLGKEALAMNNAMLAWQYAEQANAIYPKSEEVAAFYKQAVDARDIVLSGKNSSETVAAPDAVVEKISAPIEDKNKALTIRQMVEKAEELIEKRDWFNAHYWATLAVKACDGTNTNLQVAQDIANTAWNQLSNPVRSPDDEINKFYARKKEGYTALVKGDCLQAYYIFTELDGKAEHYNDPDIEQYLAISKERVETNYFFIDETDNLTQFEDKKNVYFTLKHPDGSYDVIFIGGIANVRSVDGMIRYLDNFNIISYTKYGVFIRAMQVPFAKLSEISTSVLTKEQLKVKGISEKIKTVPYVILQSVDRYTQGTVSKPVYSYIPSELPDGVAIKLVDIIPYIESRTNKIEYNMFVSQMNSLFAEETTSIVLDMPFADFDYVTEASYGAENMSILSLIKFLSKSVAYGYSQEVYLQTLLSKCTMPLLLLIILVFAASMAWNYRLDEKSVFKFKWLIVFPLFTSIVFVLLKCVMYVASLIDFCFIGLAGPYALPIEFVVYVIILIFVSVNFLSRSSK